MKTTMIKKFNVIISLWLIAVIAILCVFGFKLNININIKFEIRSLKVRNIH